MDKVRLGLIGCGGIARHHLNGIKDIGECQVVGLADPSSAQVEQTLRQHPWLEKAAVFTNEFDMMDGVELDAVMISTPHNVHLPQMEGAFSRGLHVLCEKPLALAVAECRQAIAARDASGRIGALAYQRHTQPEYMLIRKKIQSGEFGGVRYVAGLLCQEWKRFTMGSWRQEPIQAGGGMLFDSGSHLLDVMLWCTGLQPETVSAFTDNRETPVDIDSAVAVRFANGALGTITVVGDAHAWNEDLTIWCEKGAFFIRGGKLTIVDELGGKLVAEGLRGGSSPVRNFVNAVLGREDIQASFEAGLAVMALTEAVWDAVKAGGPVPVARQAVSA